MLGVFLHGQMDGASYVKGVFESHLAKIGLTGENLRGKTILEIGPGDSVGTAMIAYCYGARSILIDTGKFAKTSFQIYSDLADFLLHFGLRPPDLNGVKNLDDLLERCNACYLTNGLTSFSKVETASIDLIFSQAVLEHIRKHEFDETMRECFRVIKPNGVVSHRIDLRDHLGGALNNLRFSEKIWESKFFTDSGFYTNRIQFGEMCSAFKQAGFSIDVLGVERWEHLPTPQNALAEPFRSIPEELLLIKGFDVLFYPNLKSAS
jgi:SAM-dependent methyltransferase